MGITKEKSGSGWVVGISGDVGVSTAAALKDALLEAVESSAEGGVVLDLGEVESIDVCCLQLILAAVRGSKKPGGLKIGSASAALRDTVALAGLDSDQWPMVASSS
ncbi:MAG: STAS domain-containing protein [Pseudomonadota bacterium]